MELQPKKLIQKRSVAPRGDLTKREAAAAEEDVARNENVRKHRFCFVLSFRNRDAA